MFLFLYSCISYCSWSQPSSFCFFSLLSAAGTVHYAACALGKTETHEVVGRVDLKEEVSFTSHGSLYFVAMVKNVYASSFMRITGTYPIIAHKTGYTV